MHVDNFNYVTCKSLLINKGNKGKIKCKKENEVKENEVKIFQDKNTVIDKIYLNFKKMFNLLQKYLKMNCIILRY